MVNSKCLYIPYMSHLLLKFHGLMVTWLLALVVGGLMLAFVC